MAEQRDRHPFYMYDAIRAQPEAFVRVLEQNETATEDFAVRVSTCERLFLVGIGTSYNAAHVGEHLVREYGGGIDVRAVHSFDFALYGPDLRPGDCVVAVSHRGSKRYTALALERAREAGCPTALVTGEGSTVAVRPDAVFETVPQERSSAHTVSYTGTVAVLAQLAGLIGRHRGAEVLGEDVLRNRIPEALSSSLGTEGEVEALAREHSGHRRIWLAGGGPSAVTAEEVAIKVKESSYLQAEGMATEALLHGPFQCVEDMDLFILIAPAGAAQGRTLEVAELAAEIGGPCLVVDDGTAEPPRGVVGRIVVPEVPEPLSALTCLVPLQLFAYHLALARGTNPDIFRVDDPRFARADVSGRL